MVTLAKQQTAEWSSFQIWAAINFGFSLSIRESLGKLLPKVFSCCLLQQSEHNGKCRGNGDVVGNLEISGQ